jgi:hypothetical protein
MKMIDLLNEMPHFISQGKGIDLRIEKYDISDEEKRKILIAFQKNNLYGFSEKTMFGILLNL